MGNGEKQIGRIKSYRVKIGDDGDKITEDEEKITED